MTPDWMPPLPQVEGLRVGEAHAEIEAFAMAAVEAYKRSMAGWQVSYRAGALAMQERAVGMAMEWTEAARKDGREYGVGMDIASSIRALDVDA